MRVWLVLLAILGAVAAPVMAQEAEDNGRIIRFLEEELSTENREIRLSGIEGILASNSRVAEITIADREGIWLTIRNASIVWSRLALFGGRLDIQSLGAETIEITRRPLPEDAAPSLEAQPFQIPDLPISVEIGSLDVDRLVLGEPVLGQAADLTISGALSLISGGLDTDVRITRLDREGGEFVVQADYDPDERTLGLRVGAVEPPDGIFANLLGIEGRPSIDLVMAGEGPVDDLDVALSLATDGERRVTGNVSLRGVADGIGFNGLLSGQIDTLASPTFGAFLAGESRVVANGVVRTGGGLTLNQVRIATGALDINGSLQTTSDGFLQRARFSGTMGSGEGQTILPVAGGGTSIERATLFVDYGTADEGEWFAEIAGSKLISGDITAGTIGISADGTIENPTDPTARGLTIDVDTILRGLEGMTPQLSQALGQDITLGLQSRWQANTPFVVDALRLAGNGLAISAAGEFADLSFQGTIDAEVSDLDRFSSLAQRSLGGSASLGLKGRVSPVQGSFDLEVEGSSQALKLDIPTLDRLLVGETELGGQIIRDITGLQTRNISLTNDQIRIRSDGILANTLADFGFDLRLADLADLGLDATGPVSVSGEAEGRNGIIEVTAEATLPEGSLSGREVNGITAGFDGVMEAGTIRGRLRGGGTLDGSEIGLSGRINARSDGQQIDDLLFRVGNAQLIGRLVRSGAGLLTGGVGLNADDIGPLAALLLQDATGQVRAELDFSHEDDRQMIEADGEISDIAFGNATIAGGAVNGRVDNAFGVPAISGTLRFNDAKIAGIGISGGWVEAKTADGTTTFTAETALDTETDLKLAGQLTDTGDGYAIGLDQLDLIAENPLVQLAQPAMLTVAPEVTEIDTLTLEIGGGTVSLVGRVASQIAVDARIEAVALDVLNAVVPDLGVSGSLSGQASIFGPTDAPNAEFAVAASEVTTAAIASANLPPVDLDVTGTTQNGDLALDATLEGPSNFTATLAGTVPLDDGELDLSGQLDRFPVAIVDRLAGSVGLRGRLNGRFSLAGPLFRPRADFALDGQALSADALAANAIAPINVTAVGAFEDQTIELQTFRAENADGMNFTARGTAPLELDGLNIAAQGRVPLAISRVGLASAGVRADGIVNLDLTARGRISDPVFAGNLSLEGGTALLPRVNLRLDDLAASASLAGDRLSITSVRARNSSGGQITGSGFVTLSTRRNFPADIDIGIRDLRYSDGRLATATASGDLKIAGPLLGNGRLSGQIDVAELEFRVPDTSRPTSQGFQLDLRHEGLTPRLEQTLTYAGKVAGASETTATSTGGGLGLDIAINAPSRVFVRGRGLDAQLGGQLRIGGTTGAIRPVGQINLIRGRFQLLGQRFELSSGFIRFVGEIIPEILLQARTAVGEVEATIAVTGPATRPEIDLSSVPELPDDEILAQIVFGRATAELSPLQIARLASALGALAGRRTVAIFETLRDATGLDDFDVDDSEDGTTTFRAGKFIRDNIYSTLETDTTGETRVTIELDVTTDFSVRGSVGTSGDTSFGIFFERDY